MDYKKLVDKRTKFTKMPPMIKVKGAIQMLTSALEELEEEYEDLLQSNQELRTALYEEILNNKE